MNKLEDFFLKLEKLNSEEFMKLVESRVSDDQVEIFVEHIAEFYGIDDDEELGTLAQIMITGYLAAQECAGDPKPGSGPQTIAH